MRLSSLRRMHSVATSIVTPALRLLREPRDRGSLPVCPKAHEHPPLCMRLRSSVSSPPGRKPHLLSCTSGSADARRRPPLESPAASSGLRIWVVDCIAVSGRRTVSGTLSGIGTSEAQKLRPRGQARVLTQGSEMRPRVQARVPTQGSETGANSDEGRII